MFLSIEDFGPTVSLRTEFDSNGLNTSNVFKFYGPISWFIFIGYPARTPTLKISGGLGSNFFSFGFTGFLIVWFFRILGSSGLWKFFKSCQFNGFCVIKNFKLLEYQRVWLLVENFFFIFFGFKFVNQPITNEKEKMFLPHIQKFFTPKQINCICYKLMDPKKVC